MHHNVWTKAKYRTLRSTTESFFDKQIFQVSWFYIDQSWNMVFHNYSTSIKVEIWCHITLLKIASGMLALIAFRKRQSYRTMWIKYSLNCIHNSWEIAAAQRQNVVRIIDYYVDTNSVAFVPEINSFSTYNFWYRYYTVSSMNVNVKWNQ